VESVDDKEEHWRKEKVAFNAAYGGEKVMAYLFLPRGVAAPYQTVVYFPGSNALQTRSSESLGGMAWFDFVIRSGRAVMYPIYKSTYERGDELTSDVATATSLYRDHVIMWSKDLGRSIDYLATRKDLDTSKLAYYGLSWGAALGAILPAVDERIKVCVLFAGGFDYGRTLPEVDAINFAPHVKVPTLMLNGRYDYFFGVEKSQAPMFRLLGAPEKDKRHVVFEAGHVVPRDLMSKDVLDWLDRYVGPVK
jgi:cephalosporin-C deacetylase-like acetyl esterase